MSVRLKNQPWDLNVHNSYSLYQNRCFAECINHQQMQNVKERWQKSDPYVALCYAGATLNSMEVL